MCQIQRIKASHLGLLRPMATMQQLYFMWKKFESAHTCYMS